MHPTDKPGSGPERLMTFTVKGNPIGAPPPQFANFVAVSHAGTEVQLEFIFLDINEIATNLADPKKEKPTQLMGQTVAKLIMPAAQFLQLKEHLATIFARLQEASHVSSETSKETAQQGRRRVAGT